MFFVTRQAFGVDYEVQHFFTSSTFSTEKVLMFKLLNVLMIYGAHLEDKLKFWFLIFSDPG